MTTRHKVPASLRCIGCGLEFASSEAFDMHSAGRRRAPLGSPKRCRTEVEMRALGMHQTSGKRWSVARMRP